MKHSTTSQSSSFLPVCSLAPAHSYNTSLIPLLVNVDSLCLLLTVRVGRLLKCARHCSMPASPSPPGTCTYVLAKDIDFIINSRTEVFHIVCTCMWGRRRHFKLRTIPVGADVHWYVRVGVLLEFSLTWHHQVFLVKRGPCEVLPNSLVASVSPGVFYCSGTYHVLGCVW